MCTPNIAIQERAYDEDLYLILANVVSNKDMGGFVVWGASRNQGVT